SCNAQKPLSLLESVKLLHQEDFTTYDYLSPSILKLLQGRKVKVKVLKSALIEDTVERIAQRIAQETDSKIIQIIGHTFTLYKPKRRIR
ncbi:MAG: hypothetical protein QW341_04220, partial [Candidatus Bathyarchaeia archaeon]